MFRNQYDTDVTTWNPEGRLYQIEYAIEALKQGSACVGATSNTHVVLAGIKRSPSELASYQQKIFRIDDHMGIVISGLTADGRSLCKYMRSECLNHKFMYDSPLQTERLVMDVADKHQQATQSYVRRPYGIGLLIAGYDRTGPHLFQTDPSGNYFEYRAMAMGARSQSAKTYLEKHYTNFSTLSRDELIRETVRALHGCLEPGKEFDLNNTSIAIVGNNERFHILEGEELAPYIAGLGVAQSTEMAVEEESTTNAASNVGASSSSTGAMQEE